MADPSKPDPKHLEIALYHANIIQHRKDVENRIFENLEELIDYPLIENHSADNPASKDVTEVSDKLQLLMQLDWDNLIDERRRSRKCGYVLCPNKLEKQSSSKFRIFNTAKSMEVIASEEVDAWCSHICQTRAEFVKTQLGTEPAWTRKEESPIKFSFLGKDSKLITVEDKKTLEPVQEVAERAEKLSLNDKFSNPQPLLADSVVEKSQVTPAKAPSLEETGNGNRIEGYTI
jgi:hypothetical protein